MHVCPSRSCCWDTAVGFLGPLPSLTLFSSQHIRSHSQPAAVSQLGTLESHGTPFCHCFCCLSAFLVARTALAWLPPALLF